MEMQEITTKTAPRHTDPAEISPREFTQFIGKQMVLALGHHVEYAPRAESGPNFDYYHGGKNSPERKDYIMDKLVAPVVE